MNQPFPSTDVAVREIHEVQAADYRSALALADHLLATWSQDTDPSATLRKIAALVEKAGAARQHWAAQGAKMGPQAAPNANTLIALVETLAARIRLLEDLASASRSKLLPEMNDALRSRLMLRAYAGAGRPSASP